MKAPQIKALLEFLDTYELSLKTLKKRVEMRDERIVLACERFISIYTFYC